MRKAKNQTYTQEFQSSQHYNPSLLMTYRDRAGTYSVFLSAGTSDDISVFREGSTRYVLSVNRGLPYVGLQVIEAGQVTGEVFFQEHQCEESLGPEWESRTPINLAKRLAEWCH